MAVCDINIKADNGQPSLLFKSVMSSASTIEEGFNTYYFTKTNKFKDWYKEYTDNTTDQNGEPMYDKFSDEAYTDDVDYVREEDQSMRDVYVQYAKVLPGMLATLDDRIEALEGGGNTEYVQELKKLRDDLVTQDPKGSLSGLITTARLHVKNLRKKSVEAFNKADDDESIRYLANLNRIAQSYSVIGELRQELLGITGVSDILGAAIEESDNIESDMAFINGKYIAKSMKMLAKSIKKVRPDWKDSDIDKMIKESPADIDSIEHWLEYAGDSHDQLLYSIATLVQKQDNNTRQAMIDFGLKVNESLEKLLNQNKGKKADQIYGDAIVQLANGETHVVDPNMTREEVAPEMLAAYDKVQRNPALKEFLSFYNEQKVVYDAMLPPGEGTGSRIPSIPAESVIQEFKEKGLKKGSEALLNKMKKSFLRSNLDIERGDLRGPNGGPARRVPVFFTKMFDKEVFEAKYKELYDAKIAEGANSIEADADALVGAELYAKQDMSKILSNDLGQVLQTYAGMAMSYSNKNEILHTVESALAVAGSSQRKYLIDSGGRKVFSRANKEKQTTPLTGKEANAPKMLQTFLDMHFFGIKQEDMGSFTVPFFGFEVDTNKLLRKLNASTSAVQMTGHLRGAFSNFLMGEASNVTEAVAKEYFNTADMHAATKAYMSDVPQMAKDGLNRYQTGFTTLLEQRLNILQEPVTAKLTGESSSFRRMFRDGSWMYMANAQAEHFIQVRAGMAMLHNTKVYDENGKETGNLLNAYSSSQDERVLNRPDVYIKRGDKLFAYDDVQENLIIQKVQAVNRRVQGNWSSNSQTKSHQNGWTSLLMKFRGYLYPGLVRRFGKKRKNFSLDDQELRGFYRSAGEHIPKLVKSLAQFKTEVARADWNKLSPHEKANIRRFVTEAGFMVASASAAALLTAMLDNLFDDYDDDDLADNLALGAYYNLIYVNNRLFTELAGFWNPVEAIKLMRSPAASISILENSMRLLKQLTSPLEEYQSGARKGELKLKYRAQKVVPLWNQLGSLFSVDDIKTLNNFYNQ